MKISNMERAEVLVHALPYIKRYVGKIVVIKYGGNAMINEELKQQVMEDLVLLHLIGVNVVLVHGGGPDVSSMMKRLGKEPQFIDGLRVTDKETIDIAQMVLAGKINKDLVNLIEKKGGPAIGLSGIDGHMIQCHVKDEKLGYVGEIDRVNILPVLDVLDKGYIPVVSTIGCDDDGNTYNINGDTAAAAIAGMMHAERLLMMTDIAGVLEDKDDPNTLITNIKVDDIDELYKNNIIGGGMIPKIECCRYAVNQGVKKVTILDGRVPHSILMELLTNEGAGTMVWKGDND